MLDCAPNAGSSSGCSFYSPIPHLTPIACLARIKRWGIAENAFWGEVDSCSSPAANPVLAPGFWQMKLRSAGPAQHCGCLLAPCSAPTRWSPPWLQMSPRSSWFHVSVSSMGTLSRWARSTCTAVIEIYSQDFTILAGLSCSWRLAGTQQDFDDWLWQKTRPLILLLSWNSFEAENIFMWYSTNILLRFIKHKY